MTLFICSVVALTFALLAFVEGVHALVTVKENGDD